MQQELTTENKVLNTFLRLMVGSLLLLVIAIPIILLLNWMNLI